MTPDRVIERLENILLSAEEWRQTDQASGYSEAAVYRVGYLFLRNRLAYFIADLKA